MMPVQNTGAAKPIIENTVIDCDNSPFGRREASTPSAVPTTNASSTEKITSSSVAGSRSAISSDTGRLKKYE